MFSKIRAFLRQPFPFEISLGWRFASAFIAGLFVSIFLMVFKPFGSGDYVLQGRAWILWGYGFVTFFVILVNTIVWPAVFPGFFHDAKWNVGKGIGFQLGHILSIGAANFLFAALVGRRDVTLSAVPAFLWQALAVGLFLVVIGVFSVQKYLLNKFAESTRRINEELASSRNRIDAAESRSEAVGFSSESGKEKVEILRRDLLFVKSVDNYVEIYRTDKDQLKKTILRSSLTRLERDLKDRAFLFKCHRAYLVNIPNISRVAGNSQGYQLIFKGVEFAVPVSRKTSKDLFKLITKPRAGRSPQPSA